MHHGKGFRSPLVIRELSKQRESPLIPNCTRGLAIPNANRTLGLILQGYVAVRLLSQVNAVQDKSIALINQVLLFLEQDLNAKNRSISARTKQRL